MESPHMFLLLLTVFLGKSFSFLCPHGSLEIPDEHVCIYPVNQSEYYPNAVRECLKRGADLVKIRNGFENSVLFGLIDTDFNDVAPYIGVEKRRNGTWTYADGSPLQYLHWAPGEPNNTEEQSICAIMDPQTTKWISADCSTLRPYFCGVDGDVLQCPEGWIYRSQNDSCYWFSNFTYTNGINWQMHTWQEAEGICRKFGAHLVSIHSADEENFLYDLILTNSMLLANESSSPCTNQWAWIGLMGTAEPQDTWSDGSRFDYVGVIGSRPSSAVPWAISNDPSCHYKNWQAWSNSYDQSRFVCKMPAPSRK